MRQGQQNRRGRGRNNNNRKSQNPLSRSFESNGPEMKIRGTPAHIAEKYLALARDAQSSGDPVLAENYHQHAEHYIRIIMAYREQLNQPGDGMNGSGQRAPGEAGEGDEGDFGEDDEREEAINQVLAPEQPQFQPQHQPMHQQGGRQHEGNRQEGNRHEGNRQDRPFRRDRDNRGYRDRNHQQGDGRPQQAVERQPEPVAEGGGGGGGGGDGRRRERFQQNEQPDFLRRPVRRARNDSDEAGPGKDE